jgi:hypothetical protein
MPSSDAARAGGPHNVTAMGMEKRSERLIFIAWFRLVSEK